MQDKEKTIKKWHTVLIVSIVVIAAILAIYQRFHWSTINIELKGDRLELLYAQNRYQQYRGLGKRNTMKPYGGMIFMFSFPERHGIVMRDMRFPIDIVWLHDGEVIDFVKNVAPEPGVTEDKLKRYYPRKEANIVLELPAGWAQEHDLRIGDKLTVIND